MSAGNFRTWPFGAAQPWNQSLSHWQRLGLADAGGAGRLRVRDGGPGRAGGGRPGLDHLRPVAAHLGRPRQRSVPDPGRRHPDRVRPQFLVEVGPQPIITNNGLILLLHNAAVKFDDGTVRYTCGQLLFDPARPTEILAQMNYPWH